MAEIILSIISIIVTAGGLYFVASQIADSRRFMQAQFVNQLEADISELYDTYIALLPNNRFHLIVDGEHALDEKDLIGIMKYLGFFEKVKLIVDNKTIDLSTVDKLFAYRFFLIVNHKLIQDEVLYNDAYKGFFNSIFSLYKEWHKYRCANDFDIPFCENDLMSNNSEMFNSFVKNHECSRQLC